jgi:Tfp pilus assembly protein PilN
VKSVNLLPADLRGTEFADVESPAGPTGAGGPAAFFVLGALALAVVAMAASVLASNSVKQNRAELAEVTASQAGARQQVAALKPYADYRDLAEGRIQSVRQLATSRFDWERALRDVSRTMPEAVSLESIDASLGTGDSEGSSPLRGAIKAPAIQLKGCTRDQREVARMMARLRGVQGVTRVSLSQSQKDDVQKGASSSTVSEGGDKPLCGPGSHPTFDMVIFFERDAALSSEPNVQATPATGGATPSAGGATPAAGGSSSSSSSASTASAGAPQGGGTP